MRVQQPIVALVFAIVGAWGQQPQGPLPSGPGGTPLTPKAGALIDLTGYWASAVPEDSRFRMFTPPKGDFAGIPLNVDGTKLAKEWDAAKDETSGQQCKSYGAAAIMGIPGRFRITWDNDTTLKIETESGTQTRLLHFNAAPPQTEAPSWQGYSVAAWDATLKHGKRGGGSLKVTTANLRPGYLRKNGVPYSGKTTVTEYYDLVSEPGAVLVINTKVEDPTYLAEPFRTSTNLRPQRGTSGWSPSPCSAR